MNLLARRTKGFLRITRILRCLTTLGLRDEAQAFFRALLALYREYHDVIGSTTRET